jgi:hypothetical protein
MSKLNKKIIQPHSILIEQTAGQYAAIFWEACRSSGMKAGRHKTARAYARANLEKFIPLVVKNLTDIMSRPETPVEMKETIYQAILERTNDEQVNTMGAQASLPDFMNTPLYKPDNEKPKPVIINSPRLDFSFDNKKV